MLYVLTINHPTKGQMHWYFEGEVDEVCEEFEKAKALAKDLGIYEDETDDERISDFFEFENCMREDGLIPQEDELTKALVDFREAREVYDAANKHVAAAIDHRDTVNRELSKANDKAMHLLPDGAVKVIDGKAFVKQGSWILIKDVQ